MADKVDDLLRGALMAESKCLPAPKNAGWQMGPKAPTFLLVGGKTPDHEQERICH